MPPMRPPVTLAALAFALAPAAATRAGNESSFFLGNMAALSGGAVTVVGDDGASLWYNPAGLVVEKRDRIDLSGSAYTLRLRDYPGILRGDLPDRDQDADPRVDLSTHEFMSVPSSIAYVRHVSSTVSLGFGLFVPLLDRFSTSSELSLREETIDFDGAVELTAETTVYAGAFGVGWHVAPRLRLGASLAVYYQSAELAQTLLFGFTSPDPVDQSAGNGAVVVEDDIERFGFAVFFGAQWQVSDDWGLGLVLRTPLVQIYESLERRRFQLYASISPDGSGATLTEFAPLRRSRFDASVFFNFAATLAIAWTPEPHAFLSLELDLQPGSNDDGIEREFVWDVRLGGVLPLCDTLRIGAGLFTDRSWEPDPETSWIDKVDYYGAATGIYFETPLALADNPDASTLVFTSTFGLRYAIGLGTTLRAVADANGIRTDPDLVSIDLVFHEISLHVGSGLKF